MNRDNQVIENQLEYVNKNLAIIMNTIRDLVGGIKQANESLGHLLASMPPPPSDPPLPSLPALKFAVGDMMSPARGYLGGPYPSLSDAFSFAVETYTKNHPRDSLYVFEVQPDGGSRAIYWWDRTTKLWISAAGRARLWTPPPDVKEAP
jgi:hypothetical protein